VLERLLQELFGDAEKADKKVRRRTIKKGYPIKDEDAAPTVDR